MGFIMDGLDAEDYDRQYSDRVLVRRIASYFRPQLPRMAVVSLMILFSTLANTGLPIYVSRAIDQLQEDTSTNTILTIAAVTGLLGCLAWAFNAVRQDFSSRAVGNVVLHIREDAFDAVLKRDLSFYDTYSSGKIVSRVTSDSQAFSQVVTLTMDLLSQTLFVFVLMGYLLSVNVRLALMVMAIAPMIVFIALAFRKIARDAVTQSRRVGAEVSSHIQESISGIGVAKTFRQEHAIYGEFQDVNAQSYRINLRTGYIFNSIFPILSLVAGLG
ncbi:MAG: ABC transporter ATP-binding protein, partial [Chloroflexi bacterium]